MQYTWQIGAGNIPLILEIQYQSIPVSGIVPTVEVYRQSDDFVLDWIGASFVATVPIGGNNLGSMFEILPGIYRRFFNPQSYGDSDPNQYLMIYRAQIPSGYNNIVGYDISVSDSELHIFENVASGVSISSSMIATFVE